MTEKEDQMEREQFVIERTNDASEHIQTAVEDIGQGFRGSAKSNLKDAISDLERCVEALDGELDVHLGIEEAEEE